MSPLPIIEHSRSVGGSALCILAVLPSIPLRPRLENTHAHIKRERVSKEEERPQGQASSERECMGGWDTQADESGKACWGEREREKANMRRRREENPKCCMLVFCTLLERGGGVSESSGGVVSLGLSELQKCASSLARSLHSFKLRRRSLTSSTSLQPGEELWTAKEFA